MDLAGDLAVLDAAELDEPTGRPAPLGLAISWLMTKYVSLLISRAGCWPPLPGTVLTPMGVGSRRPAASAVGLLDLQPADVPVGQLAEQLVGRPLGQDEHVPRYPGRGRQPVYAVHERHHQDEQEHDDRERDPGHQGGQPPHPEVPQVVLHRHLADEEEQQEVGRVHDEQDERPALDQGDRQPAEDDVRQELAGQVGVHRRCGGRARRRPGPRTSAGPAGRRAR